MEQQDTNIQALETDREMERSYERESDESATGRDRPGGDGTVGQEQINAIGEQRSDAPTGQDHSTDREETPNENWGVAAIQDREDRTSGISSVSE
jgi:hypothetical protein